MSFHTLNYSSHVLGNDIKTHRAVYGTRTTPVQSMSTSSVIFESADHLSNSKKSNCVLDTLSVRGASGGFMVNKQNAVGIMGGVSVDSSLSFAGKLVKWSSNDEEAGLPFVLCADPLLNKKLVQYERSSLSLYGRGECLKLDQTSIVENLRSKRVFLGSSGAQCIAMPCHISHSWYDEVSKGCSVPVLHMGECVARELKEAKLRPLEAGSPLRIGVLATSATLLAGFYQEKLQNEGFEEVLPDKATMEHTVIPAIEALSRKDIEGARTLLRIALQVLLVRAVNTVILAWDDMRELLPPDDPLLKKCVDPLDALARSCIHYAQSA